MTLKRYLGRDIVPAAFFALGPIILCVWEVPHYTALQIKVGVFCFLFAWALLMTPFSWEGRKNKGIETHIYHVTMGALMPMFFVVALAAFVIFILCAVTPESVTGLLLQMGIPGTLELVAWTFLTLAIVGRVASFRLVPTQGLLVNGRVRRDRTPFWYRPWDMTVERLPKTIEVTARGAIGGFTFSVTGKKDLNSLLFDGDHVNLEEISEEISGMLRVRMSDLLPYEISPAKLTQDLKEILKKENIILCGWTLNYTPRIP